MLARWVTFFVWAAAAASALAWGLKLMVTPPQAPPLTMVADTHTVARGDLTRLLGVDAPAPVAAAAPEPTADARFNLLGVVSPRAPKAAAEGVALIAVDGKPAKAYRVGSLVDGQNVLQSVQVRSVTLGPKGGPSLIALNIVPPAPATTGVLPPPTVQPGAPTFTPPQPTALPVPLQTAPPPQTLPQPRGGRSNDALR